MNGSKSWQIKKKKKKKVCCVVINCEYCNFEKKERKNVFRYSFFFKIVRINFSWGCQCHLSAAFGIDSNDVRGLPTTCLLFSIELFANAKSKINFYHPTWPPLISTYIFLIFLFMLCLFRRKIIFKKLFQYFSVFGMGKNNSQPENDFCLTKNA
jgi:hypothetical protein